MWQALKVNFENFNNKVTWINYEVDSYKMHFNHMMNRSYMIHELKTIGSNLTDMQQVQVVILLLPNS